jgi:hypothetical protein
VELFGIALSIPASFMASIVYAFIVGKMVSIWPFLSQPLKFLSISVLFLLAIEIGGVLTLGVVGVQEVVGSAYYWIHLSLFALAVPSLVNIMRIQRTIPLFSKWYVIGPLCSLFGLATVLFQYHVSEVLFGID